MTDLIVEKIETKKAGGNSLLDMTLCNKSKTKYFLEKRFVHSSGDKSLEGFKVNQNGKVIRNKGRRVKRKASKFPDDYVSIEPSDCISFTVMLNDFFDFEQDREFTLSYLIINSNPLTNELDKISFDTKITIGMWL